MKLRQRKSPLLLLLVPSLAATAVLGAATPGSRQLEREAPPPDSLRADTLADPAKKYGTKDAPVDGKDGKPHAGPFVDYEPVVKTDSDDYTIKGRPSDPTIIDGEKIPETNDGVMNDPNRLEPKEGTTGTSGGVSEKDKERKLKESTTGEKTENKPKTPKEAPPLPHSDEEKILQQEGKYAGGGSGKTYDDVSGLEVCSFP